MRKVIAGLSRGIVGNGTRLSAVALTAAYCGFVASPASAQEIQQECRVIVAMDLADKASGALAALDLRLGYVDTVGQFAGTGGNVDCHFLAQDALAYEHDADLAREINLGMVSVSGVSLPADLWSCTFVTSDTPPAPEDFSLVVDAATRANFTDLPVEASVRDVACDLDADCGNGVIEGQEECDDGQATATCTVDCALKNDLEACTVTFFLEGEQALGALQMTVDYSAAGGNFEGSAGNVSCASGLETAFTAENDRDGEKELELAFISSSGVTPPADLWTCRFLTSLGAPTPQELPITKITAINPSRAQVSANVGIEVSGCDNVSGVCGDADGNGTVQAGDALRILKVSVGQPLSCPITACDADSSGAIRAADALRVLRKAVGQNVEMNCPAA